MTRVVSRRSVTAEANARGICGGPSRNGTSSSSNTAELTCHNHVNTYASTIGAIIFKLIIPSFKKLKKMDSRIVTCISCLTCTEDLSRIRRIGHSCIHVLILEAA